LYSWQPDEILAKQSQMACLCKNTEHSDFVEAEIIAKRELKEGQVHFNFNCDRDSL
jgi:hypothetical protein